MKQEDIKKMLEQITNLFSDKENKNEICYDANKYDYLVGENYFIRTVTHILVGRLVHKTESELVLDKCSWVANTGRYSDSLKDGKMLIDERSEIEPYHPEDLVHVNRGSFIDAVRYRFELPTEQK